MLNAHNIRALGLCKVSGRHIGEAANESEPRTMREIEEAGQADARAILRKEKRAFDLAMDRPTEMDRATWRAER